MGDLLAFADTHSFLVAALVLGGGMTFLAVALVLGEVIKAVYRR